MQTCEFHPTQTTTRAIKKLDDAVREESMTSVERDMILEFLDERAAMKRQFTEGRYFKVAGMLRRFRESKYLAVPWTEITHPEYLKAIGRVRRAKYSEETIRDYIVLTRLFYGWLIRKGHVPGDMTCLREVELPPKPKPKIKKEWLMTEGNIVKMTGSARTVRDKAMIAVWYECALRANEVAGLTWGNITYEDQAARVVCIDTKENTQRTGFVITGLEHLIMWRNMYPGAAEGEAPVFLSKLGKRLEYRNMAKLLNSWQDLAGLPRTPTHYMRKSRVTNMVLQKIPEYVVKSVVWNNQKTASYDAYMLATETDIRDGLLVSYGLKRPTEAQTPIGPVPCPACRYVNAPDSEYCRHCGEPLTDDGLALRDRVRAWMDIAMAERSAVPRAAGVGSLTDEQLLAELMRRRAVK